MKKINLTKKQKKKLIRILLSLFIFLSLLVIDKIINLSGVFNGCGRWLFPFVLFFCNFLLIGYDILIKATKNIFHGQIFDENFLMMIATFGAFALAIYRGVNGLEIEGFDEACAVIIFYQIGEFFQSYAVGKSRKSIKDLMNIRPDYANLKIQNEIKVVSPEEIKIDDILIINPGEKIPIDGIVIKGETSLNTSALTGESKYLDVKVGDEVVSGTINISSQIEIRATKLFYDSSVSKILNLVEKVSSQKSKIENFTTKFARFYTPIVCVFALFLAIVPSLIYKNFNIWIYRALSFLVVSCPCALVISIPLSFFMGIGLASKQGILIKGSNYLEKINRANIFVFDKTGTITKGNFEITEIVPKNKQEEILKYAAIAEQFSSHPISKCIVEAYHGKIENDYSLENVAGKGVVATKDDEQILCGNKKLLLLYNIKIQDDELDLGTNIYVAKNGNYIGKICISDTLKSESKQVISSLNNQSYKTIMLTGDNEKVANYIATETNINEYYSSLLPQNKVEKLNDILKEKNKRDVVCFVGDGINDAPALMLADVGVSMGAIGSDAAIEASDIVLMNDDLNSILKLKSISKRTMKTVWQNIIFSIFIKVLILVLSAFGITTMWLAIFGDVGVAILAIINSMKININKCNFK